MFSHYWLLLIVLICLMMQPSKQERGGEPMDVKTVREDIYRMTERIEEISDLYRIRRLCYWLLHRN